jgi:hypothetical protein
MHDLETRSWASIWVSMQCLVLLGYALSTSRACKCCVRLTSSKLLIYPKVLWICDDAEIIKNVSFGLAFYRGKVSTCTIVF